MFPGFGRGFWMVLTRIVLEEKSLGQLGVCGTIAESGCRHMKKITLEKDQAVVAVRDGVNLLPPVQGCSIPVDQGTELRSGKAEPTTLGPHGLNIMKSGETGLAVAPKASLCSRGR